MDTKLLDTTRLATVPLMDDQSNVVTDGGHHPDRGRLKEGPNKVGAIAPDTMLNGGVVGSAPLIFQWRSRESNNYSRRSLHVAGHKRVRPQT